MVHAWRWDWATWMELHDSGDVKVLARKSDDLFIRLPEGKTGFMEEVTLDPGKQFSTCTTDIDNELHAHKLADSDFDFVFFNVLHLRFRNGHGFQHKTHVLVYKKQPCQYCCTNPC